MAPKKIISTKTLASALVLIFLLFLSSALSFASELDEIKKAIKEKGAKWVAGETSVSSLPPDQRKLRASLIKPNKVEDADLLISVEPPPTGLPISIDWRSYETYDYVTSVRNQGNCGSCWAFATAGALESYILIRDNLFGQDINLAEQILVSCSGAGSCSGGYVEYAANFIRDTGLPLESCYPYTATNGNCTYACSNWQSNTYWIGSWSYVATSSPTVDVIKNALNAYGPLVTTMDVFTDFFSYKSGTYSHVSGNYEGGHAILIIGYDDIEQHFIAKNSWGTGWGEGGFFNIAYSEINYPVEFGHWTIAYHEELACAYSIYPTSQTFTAAGGSGTIKVTAAGRCNWTAVSNASWITITSGASGTGNGSVGYTISPYSNKSPRKGTITVAGKQFTITQKGRK